MLSQPITEKLKYDVIKLIGHNHKAMSLFINKQRVRPDVWHKIGIFVGSKFEPEKDRVAFVTYKYGPTTRKSTTSRKAADDVMFSKQSI